MVAGKEFPIALPEGECRVSVSGLLDLSEPFLVARKGIADRFTGVVLSSAR